jgi:hypothetical protein
VPLLYYSLSESCKVKKFAYACPLRNLLIAVNEPGLQIQCDSCGCDLTHSIRMKCADPICEPGDGVDICPACFCAGKEFAKHKRGHAYRVVVSHNSATA